MGESISQLFESDNRKGGASPPGSKLRGFRSRKKDEPWSGSRLRGRKGKAGTPALGRKSLNISQSGSTNPPDFVLQRRTAGDDPTASGLLYSELPGALESNCFRSGWRRLPLRAIPPQRRHPGGPPGQQRGGPLRFLLWPTDCPPHRQRTLWTLAKPRKIEPPGFHFLSVRSPEGEILP